MYVGYTNMQKYITVIKFLHIFLMFQLVQNGTWHMICNNSIQHIFPYIFESRLLQCLTIVVADTYYVETDVFYHIVPKYKYSNNMIISIKLLINKCNFIF